MTFVRCIALAGALLASLTIVGTGTVWAQDSVRPVVTVLDRDVRDVVDQMEKNVREQRPAMAGIGDRERALVFMNNDNINAAALNGEINDVAYQAAQGDYAEVNQDFAHAAATAAGADFTVQVSTSANYKPGTDSDYITIVQSPEQIEQMQDGYNARINQWLSDKGLIDAPRDNWHNRLDTDFMADPSHVTDEQFRRVAEHNNDAYTRRASADFERRIRTPGGPLPVGPEHIVAYVQEMDDFADKKAKSISAALDDFTAFNDPRYRADVFRKMAQQQKYISRIEDAEDILRAQHGLGPRDRGGPSLAKQGSGRSYANSRVIREAYQRAEESFETAIGNMASTMAEVARDSTRFRESVDIDIAAILRRVSPEARDRILSRILGDGFAAVANGAAFSNAVLALPEVTSGPGVREEPLLLPPRTAYARAYAAAGQSLAGEQLLLPATTQDAFVLPELEDTSEEAARRRARLWDRARAAIEAKVGELQQG